MSSNTAPPVDTDLAATDLGPLAWVLEELRKSLDGATKATRRFVRDAEMALGSDIASLDASQLRIARQQLHQAVGALEMVGLRVPAQMLRTMESMVQRFVQRPELCSDEAATVLERASFALTEYLEGLVKGKQASAVALFPQYRAVAELAAIERVHPADLWAFDWRWTEVADLPSAPAVGYATSTREKIDWAILNVVKSTNMAASKRMVDVCLGLANGQDRQQPRTFWAIAAGFFEGLGQGLVQPNVFVKRAASRVLQQYATLSRGDGTVSERLAQDLLFFCATANLSGAVATPVLDAVRTAYGLAGARPVDYEKEQFGRYDPALLQMLRKRIASASESWSSLSGGDTNKLKLAAEQFAAVTDLMAKLHPESKELAWALARTVDASVKKNAVPDPAVAMEVATTVLYLDAVYEDLDPTDSELSHRSARLAQRLDLVTAGNPSEPMESWMEELYRRVSDRQTMGSVVAELRGSLGEVEKSLDAFFRNPQDKTPLREVPNHLASMRGVFSVLGLDQPSTAALRMRSKVEQLLIDEFDASAANPVFEQLGNNLGAMGFLIDMLSYQRELAKRLFVFDESTSELKPLMGREQTQAEPASAVEPELPAVSDAVTIVAPEAPAAAVAAAPSVSVADDEDDDGELLDIFLEEAREVVSNGLAAIANLTEAPADVGEQTVLRRAFHTLKGSSRMVGLTEFGEAAWSFEQIMNSRLAEQKSASPELLALTRSAMEAFGRWVEDISAGQGDGWRAADFRRSADAMRVDNHYLPLAFADAAMDAGTPAAVEATPDVSAEPVAIGHEVGADTEPAPAAMDLVSETDALQSAGTEVVASGVEAVADFDWDNAEVVESVEFAATQMGDAEHALDQPAPAAIESMEPLLSFEDTASASGATQSGFASTQTLDLDALESPVAPAPEPEVAPQDAFDIGNFDFGDIGGAAATPAPVAELAPAWEVPAGDFASPEPVATDSGQTEVHAPDFGLSFPVQEPEGVPLAEPSEEPQAQATQMLSLDDFRDVPAEDPEPTRVAELDDFASPQARETYEHAMAATQLAPLESIAPEAAADNEAPEPVAEELDDGGVDESVKVIGDLRLSIPLYNVYLNEADEWSRRLQTELSEWALQTHEPVPDSAIALAHSLQGSSATVGFGALSGLGRALEHALEHVQLYRAGTPAFAAVFTEASDDIRRLLHQFAAGFIKEPQPGLVEALQKIRDTEFASPESLDLPDALDDGQHALDSAAQDAEPLPAVVAEAGEAEETPAALVPAEVIAAPAPVMAAAAPLFVADDEDEDLDAVDNLDADLFPIFEEEAQELLPQLSTALRQWTGNPQDMGARNEVLRALHTVKGSARLAGAMRLGEMAHHMESSIEHLGVEGLQSAQIEPLQHRLDRLQATFDKLGKEDAAEVQESAEAAVPAEPVAALEPTSQAAVPVAPLRGTAIPISGAVRGVQAAAMVPQQRQSANQTVRVRSRLLDRLVNEAGEVLITRSRMDGRLAQIRSSLEDLGSNLERLRQQLRDVELQSESQMQSRLAQQAKDTAQAFDPLEFDRFTRVQELTRMMAESVHDVATVQRNLQREIDGTEDDLIAQGRQARELQRDLLRTRMVEFDSVSERLYGVVRQAGKDTGKQVKLDIVGGSIEMDRGVLERMVPAFEHMLRNAVSHGIEDAAIRAQAGKPAVGTISVQVDQLSNDVSVSFSDDGGGLHLDRIRARAIANGLVAADQELSEADAANLIFLPGFSTAEQVTELSGRGIGMDVVRAEVSSLGGRIETTTEEGQGSHFKLILPLTTAVTQVVMVRMGELTIGIPSNLIETVQRAAESVVQHAYVGGEYLYGSEQLPFYWAGALLQVSSRSHEPPAKTQQVVILRSAGQRMALHVDDVLGNREVVVKNLGPQLARLPGLTGMSVLASGAVVLIYNPVALATVYGERAIALAQQVQDSAAEVSPAPMQRAAEAAAELPLVLVVDDSITVRRVTQRLLKREGYRVATANDGLHALEVLMEERPKVVLSDIEMPRMDGFDLARNIRNDARLKDLPIIMITSRIAQKHRDHAKELGVNHYLGKPYSEDELLALVQRYARNEETVN